jgi:RNA polymerase sigma-70 factor (ECF subfamily)
MVTPLVLIDLDKFRAGDEAALKEIFEVIEVPLYNFSRRHLRDHDDAKDIVQETIVALWQNRVQIKSQKHLVNYVYLVAKRKIKHFTKKFPDRLSPHYHQTPDLITDPVFSRIEDEVQKQYWAARAQEIIDSSPREYAQVYRLHRQGKSNREIATELDKSHHTVRNQIAWMRDKLAQMLLAEGFTRDLLTVLFLYFLY